MADKAVDDIAEVDLSVPDTDIGSPLSGRDAEDAIAALLGGPDEDPAEIEESTADKPDKEMSDEDDTGIEPESEDVEDEDAEGESGPTYADGQFVPDGGKVQIDGRTITVKELKEYAETRAKDFQRDYSAKQEDLSGQRKAFETQQAEFSQSQERFAREREVIAEFVKATMPQRPTPPALPAREDPVAWAEYAEKQAQYDSLVQWHDHLEQGKKADEEKKTKDAEAQRQKHAETERAKFFETFPALKDKAKRTAFWDRLDKDAARFYGIPEGAAKNLDNVDMVRILKDAVAYRSLKAKSSQTQQDIEKKPVLVNGSGKRQSPEAAARRAQTDRLQRLRATGSPRDAEAAILDFLK